MERLGSASLILACLWAASPACAQTTELVSIDRSGAQVPEASQAVVSSTGRYVLFRNAGAFPTGGQDPHGWYLRDRQAGTTELVTRNNAGETAVCVGAYGGTEFADMSADARFVAFSSRACNIDPDASTPKYRAYLLDRQQNQVRLIGPNASTEAFAPRIDDSGRRVAMLVGSPNTELRWYDLASGETGSLGRSGDFAISGNGRRIAFIGRLPDLPDSVVWNQMYVFDIDSRQTRLASRALDGGFSNGRLARPTLNRDGSVLVYESYATNLASGAGEYAPIIHYVDQQRSDALRNAQGQPWYGDSPHLSDDGTRIAIRGGFPGQVSNYPHAFAYDTSTRQFMLVSQNSEGMPASMGSTSDACENQPPGVCPIGSIRLFEQSPTISGDGRYVGFHSFGTNLVDNDANGEGVDVYLRDLGSYSSGGIPFVAPVPLAASLKWLLAALVLAVALRVAPLQRR
ncbi:MAG: hypothetical protein H7125_00500 [Proteobacteria bacterium]|nr:hypothetical protein [Burkholderiales bacterium]